MAMVAEGALEGDPKDRAASRVADTFTAVVEGKEGVKSVRVALPTVLTSDCCSLIVKPLITDDGSLILDN
jgi:hypothetical protein